MKRLLILLVLVGCDVKQPSPVPRRDSLGDRAVETRSVMGYTMTAYSNGAVGISWEEPLLGFTTDAGTMHEFAVALEEVSYNTIQRKLAAQREHDARPKIPESTTDGALTVSRLIQLLNVCEDKSRGVMITEWGSKKYGRCTGADATWMEGKLTLEVDYSDP